uniref:Amino acid permease/ SLC12A domain-containing protein n=1 Tax=Arcella intermedia TaxID=1963864 RepID=A0A6B2LCQ1_9EUKA
MFPFFVMVVMGIPSVSPADWFILPKEPLTSLDWGLFINIIAFKFTGFDTISHFAGEMQHPGSFFFAMGASLLMAIVSRVLPILVVVSVQKDYSLYNEGYYTTLASAIGGIGLSSLVVFSAAVGCVVTYITYLYASAFTVYTLASKEYFNTPFLYDMHAKHQTPWRAIIATAFISFLFGMMSFEELVTISGSLYQICLVMQYAALIKLRISKPNLLRPNKIPLSTNGLIVFLIIPTLISVYLLYSSAFHSLNTFVSLTGSILFSVALYFIRDKNAHYL